MSRPTRGPMRFLPVRGSHPLRPDFPERFRFLRIGHWPGPRSLATTNGVSVDVLSSGYLDVSIRRVCLIRLCIHLMIPQRGGFPHSEIPGSTPARGFPGLIATCYVLHRLSVPRHPPNALLTLDPAKPSCTENNPSPIRIRIRLKAPRTRHSRKERGHSHTGLFS